MLKNIFYIVAGFVGGILGGMGMGGGTILIPILTTFLLVEQKSAQAINLITFIPMAIFVLIIHIKNKLIDKNVILYASIPAVLSAILGGYLATIISSEILKIAFGVFLISLSIIQFFVITPKSK